MEGGRRVGRLIEVWGGWLGWGDGGGSVDKVVGVWRGSWVGVGRLVWWLIEV